MTAVPGNQVDRGFLMPIASTDYKRFDFGHFTLDLDRGALRADGEDVSLRPQSFEVLRILVENHGRLVTKEQLHAEVWGGVAVTDDSLTHCLIDIRKAISDSDKKIIRTVPRRGFIFDVPVVATDESSAATQPTIRRATRIGVGMLVAASILVGLWFATGKYTLDQDVLTFDPPTNSIAVLPFVDLSDEQDQKYFGEALSDEIISQLSQSPELHIIARTSSFSFRNDEPDIYTISQRLNVAHILEGSVRRSGDLVRITAQFIDARDDSHIWSEIYDRRLDDVLFVQTDIAAAVASALKVTVLDLAEPIVQTDPVTFNLFGQARHIINIRDWDRLPQAIELLEIALERDPTFVRAITELGRAYHQQGFTDSVSWDEAVYNASEAIERALALDPDDAVANAFQGWHEMFRLRNHEAAAWRFRRAFAADPRNVDIIRGAVRVWLTAGRVEEAVALGEYLITHDPVCLTCQRNMALANIIAARYEQGEDQLRAILTVHPDWVDLYVPLARFLFLQGDADEALSILGNVRDRTGSYLSTLAIVLYRLGRIDEFEKIFSELSENWGEYGPLSVAMVYAAIDDKDSAFYWLEKHFSDTDFLGSMYRHPFLSSLHDDPRWEENLREYGLSDQQLAALDFNVAIPK